MRPQPARGPQRPKNRRADSRQLIPAPGGPRTPQAAPEAPASPQPNGTAPAAAAAAREPGATAWTGGLVTGWPAPRIYAKTQTTVYLSRAKPEARNAIHGAGGLARGGAAPLSVAYVT